MLKIQLNLKQNNENWPLHNRIIGITPKCPGYKRGQELFQATLKKTELASLYRIHSDNLHIEWKKHPFISTSTVYERIEQGFWEFKDI